MTERLRDSEGRYRQLVENAQDIIYRTDMWGFFTYVNPVATRVTGWPPERIVGKHFLELIREDHRNRVEAHLKAQFRDRVGTSYDEFVAVTRSGDEIWIGQNVQLLIEGVKVVGFQAVARDITQRKRAEEALERERRQLRDVVAHAPVAMAILDGEGTLVAHSEQWLTLWRLAALPLPVRRHADVLPASFAEALTRSRKGPVVSEGEELVERPDGSAVYVTWAVHPWRGPGGEVAGAVAVAQDIDVLVRARQAAQETSRVKSEFLANVSHELRTPLNGVLGMARLLLDTRLDTTQHEYAEIIRRSGRELLGVVDAILDFARAEAGRLELEDGEVDAVRIVEEVCASVAEPAAAKGLHVTSLVAEEVPRRLHGDASRLRQVLLSLLGNAVKFTPSGTVVVRAGLARGSNDPTVLRFEVADTGIGLDAATQARLFQPFVQADGSATRPYGGAGLGLALCRRIVSAMGGQIGVRSEPGQGSTFWFTVRLARRDEGAPATESDVRRGGRVLVVEDNTVNQKVAVAMIESLGYGAEAVGNGVEAVEACDRQAYDAILMDCQMPQMDGFKATAFIRQREGLSRRTPDHRPDRERDRRGPPALPLRGDGRLPEQARPPRGAGEHAPQVDPHRRHPAAGGDRRHALDPLREPPFARARGARGAARAGGGDRRVPADDPAPARRPAARPRPRRGGHDPRRRPQPEGGVGADRRARDGGHLRPDRSARPRRRPLRAGRPAEPAGIGLRGGERVAARRAAACVGPGSIGACRLRFRALSIGSGSSAC